MTTAPKDLNLKGGKNRFKFQSFTEKLALINPDIIHKTGTTDHFQLTSSDDSYLKQGVLYWQELNCTANFAAFLREVLPLCTNFTLVTLNRDEIAKILLKYLDKKDNLSLEPFIHLTTLFARDLRGEFYQYFALFVDSFASLLLVCNDAKIIEQVFHALGYLYKYLRKQLIENFVDYYRQSSKLLADKHQYIRSFSAPGLGYLLRKLSPEQMSVALKEIALDVSNSMSAEFVEGIAITMFETVKGANHGFYSKAESIYGLFLKEFLNYPRNENIAECMDQLMMMIVLHSSSSDKIACFLDLIINSMEASCIQDCQLQLRILFTAFSARKGTRTDGYAKRKLFDVLRSIKVQDDYKDCLDNFIKLCSSLIFGAGPSDLNDVSKLLDHIESELSSNNVSAWLYKVLFELEWSQATQLLLPRILSGLSKLENLKLLAYLLEVEKVDLSKLSTIVSHRRKIVLDQKVTVMLLKGLDREDWALYLIILKASELSAIDQTTLVKKLKEKFLQEDFSDRTIGTKRLMEACQILNAISSFYSPTQSKDEIKANAMLMLANFSDYDFVLDFFMCFWTKTEESWSLTDEVLNSLVYNLINPFTLIRKHSIELLLKCLPDLSSVLSTMHQVEISADTAENSREKQRLIAKVAKLYVHTADKTERLQKILIHWAYGLLKVNFRPLWSDACALFKSVVDSGLSFNLKEIIHEELTAVQEDNESNMYILDLISCKQGSTIDENVALNSDSTITKISTLVHKGSIDNLTPFDLWTDYLRNTGYRFDKANYYCLVMSQLSTNPTVICMIDKMYEVFLAVYERKLEVQNIGWAKHLMLLLKVFAELKKCTNKNIIDIFYTLLSSNDSLLQELSLKCIGKIQKVPEQDAIMNLITDDKKMRDILLELQEKMNNGDEIDGKIMVRILVGKIYGTKDKAKKSACLVFVSRCVSEIGFFLDLVTLNFVQEPESQKPDGLEVDAKVQIGFLNLLELVIKQFSSLLHPYYKKVLNVLVFILRNSKKASHDTGKTLRSLAIRRILQLFKNHPEFDYSSFLPELFEFYLAERIEKFYDENLQSVSAVMELLKFWSSDEKMKPWLFQYYQDLVPNILRTITKDSVTEDVVTFIYGFISDICEFDLFVSNEKLVSFMLQCFIDQKISNSNLATKRVEILARVSPYITEECTDSLLRLYDIYVDLLKRKDVKEYTKANIVKFIGGTFKWVGESIPNKKNLVVTISMLFYSFNHRDSRTAVTECFCNIVGEIAVANIIRNLNSFCFGRVDDNYDYEKRISSLKLLENCLTSFSYDDLMPLVYNLMYCIQDENTSLMIRQSSTALLRTLVKYVGESGEMTDIINFVIFPSIKRIIGSRTADEDSKKFYLTILNDCVLYYDAFPFAPLKCLLADGDEEANFFFNIYHIQHHRRCKSLRKLASSLIDEIDDENVLYSVVFPVVFNTLDFSITNFTNNYQQIISDSLLALTKLCSKFRWNIYYRVLKSCFLFNSRNSSIETKNKLTIRVLLAVLDAYRFPEESLDVMEEDNLDGEIDEDEDVTEKPSKQAPLSSFILPKLYNLISTTERYISLYVGYANLLTFLPKAKKEIEIPRILSKLCQLLKNKGNEELRTDVRKALIGICETVLKKDYFLFVIKQLKTALTKGYELYILLFTLNQLAHALFPSTISIMDDENVTSEIIEVSYRCLFNAVDADVKKISEASNYQAKIYDLIEAMSRTVDLNCFKKLLDRLVVEYMIMKSNSAFKQHFTEIFRRMTIGLNSNENIETVDILLLAFELMTEKSHLFDKDSKTYQEFRSPKEKDAFTVQTFARLDEQLKADTNHFRVNSVLLKEFGFSLLYSSSKKREIQIEMLETFVTVLVDHIEGGKKQDVVQSFTTTAITVYSLKTLNHLITKKRLKPTVKNQVCSKVLKILTRIAAAKSDLKQACLKSLALILQNSKHDDDIKFSDTQISSLLQMIKTDLVSSNIGYNFSLIKAVVMMKIKTPEVYDLMDYLFELMVTSAIEQVRELCRQTLVLYLLNYPMSKTRLTQHINFIVKNLSYTIEEGRASLLEFLFSILIKFPAEVIGEYMQLIFMSLSLQLINESSSRCKKMVFELMKQLIGQIYETNLGMFQQLLDMSVKLGSNPKTKLIAVLLGGIFAESFSEDSSSDGYKYVKKFTSILESEIKLLVSLNSKNVEEPEEEHEEGSVIDDEDVNDGELKEEEEETMVPEENPEQISEWSVVYACSNSVNRIIARYGKDMMLDERLYLQFIMCCYSKENSWMKKAACRLLATLLSASADPLKHHDILVKISYKMVRTIRSKVSVSEEHGLLIIQNLFRIFLILQSKAETKEEADKLLRKLTFVARDFHYASVYNRKLVFTFLLLWIESSDIPMEYIKENLNYVLRPFIAVSNVELNQDLKLHALDIMDKIEKKVGSTLFYEERQKIEVHLNNVRNQRRAERKQLKIIDPVLAAKKKIKKNLVKKVARKRKVDEYMARKSRMSVKKARNV